jgi:hypothetical protein
MARNRGGSEYGEQHKRSHREKRSKSGENYVEEIGLAWAMAEAESESMERYLAWLERAKHAAGQIVGQEVYVTGEDLRVIVDGYGGFRFAAHPEVTEQGESYASPEEAAGFFMDRASRERAKAMAISDGLLDKHSVQKEMLAKIDGVRMKTEVGRKATTEVVISVEAQNAQLSPGDIMDE